MGYKKLKTQKIVVMDQKNQYCNNDHTTQDNLQSQCNPYKITNDIFHRAEKKKHFKTSMETQKTLNTQNNLGKNEAREAIFFDFMLQCKAVK